MEPEVLHPCPALPTVGLWCFLVLGNRSLWSSLLYYSLLLLTVGASQDFSSTTNRALASHVSYIRRNTQRGDTDFSKAKVTADIYFQI